MKGKINKHGILEIYRNDKYIEMECLYHKHSIKNVDVLCGDKCSQFSEPDGGYTSNDDIVLQLCNNKILVFDELIDRRGMKDE